VNRAAAQKLGKRIIFRFHMLGQNPELGEICLSHPNLRQTTVLKFVIYYRLHTTHIEVIRIVHGYRDHGPLLSDLD
jgi:plasmid stabilization system protein ParE